MSKEYQSEEPIDPKYHTQMNDLAHYLDDCFNPGLRGSARKTGFVLLVFPFEDKDGRCSYIANSNRGDTISFMEALVKRLKENG